MQITIDTKEDSHEDIRKVIRMLQHMVGEEAYSNAPKNLFEDNSSFGQTSEQSGGIFGNIFNSGAQPETTEQKTPEKEEEIPEIVEYM